MSDEPENEYFSDGLAEELLNLLAKSQELKVAARTSSFAFKGTGASIEEIGAALGVEVVVEGSVRKAGSSVRITAQLIQVSDGFHLWSETYTREMANIFLLQDEVAGAIADALRVTLGVENRSDRGQTTDIEAYDLYLRGNDYYSRGLGDPSVTIAAEMYERAVELDPSFAVGYAALSKAYSRMIYQGLAQSDQLVDAARESAETALRLDENLPSSQAAMGWYFYWAEGEYQEAFEWFGIASEGLPNDSELLLGLGLSERRLARWEEALNHLRLSFEIDPLSNEKAIEVGISYAFGHQHQEAVDYFETAIALAPDQYRAYAHLALQLIEKDGALDDALQALRSGGNVVGRPEFVRRMLSSQPPWTSQRLMLDVFEPELGDLSSDALSDSESARYFDLLAEKYRREGRPDLEAAYADSVLTVSTGGGAGLAYARLGERAEAIRLLETPREHMSQSARTYQGAVLMEAYGHVLLGDDDEAVDLLDHALSVPGEVSYEIIRLDPLWRSLRQNPGFQALFESRGTN